MVPRPTFDRTLLQRLAELSRLHVPPERQAEVLQNMQRVTAAFDALRDLPLAPIDAGDNAAALVLRADEAEPPLPLAEVLANAPQVAAGMFVVPRVVEG
jgi:aspartyl/glutamyl-tRNA(Asn/Gln) amidotransferase C subunit